MLVWASRQHWVQHEVLPWPTCLTTWLSWERVHPYTHTCTNQSSPLTQQPHQLLYSGEIFVWCKFSGFSRAELSTRKLFPTHWYFTCKACGGCGFLALKRKINITTTKILLTLSSHSANISRYTVYIYRGVAARGITHGNGSLSEISRSGCLANLCPPPLSPPRVAVCLQSLVRLVGMTGALCRFS